METLRKKKAAATKGDRLFGHREKLAIRILVLIGLVGSSALAQMPRFGPVTPTPENSCAAALRTNQVEMSIGNRSVLFLFLRCHLLDGALAHRPAVLERGSNVPVAFLYIVKRSGILFPRCPRFSRSYSSFRFIHPLTSAF
jgi:hypothetical protein